jgi:predicted nucleic acid-binding protein
MFVDTSFCIDLLREVKRGGGPATEALRRMGNAPLLASVFVACELHSGARLSAQPERELRHVERFIENLTIVYPDSTFPVAYAELEAALRRAGIPIPTMDLLIATTAKMHGIPLMTRDAGHFRHIPGLVVESY